MAWEKRVCTNRRWYSEDCVQERQQVGTVCDERDGGGVKEFAVRGFRELNTLRCSDDDELYVILFWANLNKC